MDSQTMQGNMVQYQQPIMTPPVVNQVSPVQGIVTPLCDSLRTYSCFTVCPNCKQYINSNVERKLNSANVLCCIFCSICWSCNKICKVKDQNCYDAVHRCPNCSAVIGSYVAC